MLLRLANGLSVEVATVPMGTFYNPLPAEREIFASVLWVMLLRIILASCFVGVSMSVTLGDDEAKRRGVQKTVLERKGPPTFMYAVEMVSRNECRVHHSLEATVDAILAGRSPLFEVRQMDIKVVTDANSVGMEELDLGSHSSRTTYKYIKEFDGDFETDNKNDDDDDDDDNDNDDDSFEFKGRGNPLGRDDDSPLLLYTYQGYARNHLCSPIKSLHINVWMHTYVGHLSSCSSVRPSATGFDIAHFHTILKNQKSTHN
eukprot:Gb_09874 [translate_table: standard]